MKIRVDSKDVKDMYDKLFKAYSTGELGISPTTSMVDYDFLPEKGYAEVYITDDAFNRYGLYVRELNSEGGDSGAPAVIVSEEVSHGDFDDVVISNPNKEQKYAIITECPIGELVADIVAAKNTEDKLVFRSKSSANIYLYKNDILRYENSTTGVVFVNILNVLASLVGFIAKGVGINKMVPQLSDKFISSLEVIRDKSKAYSEGIGVGTFWYTVFNQFDKDTVGAIYDMCRNLLHDNGKKDKTYKINPDYREVTDKFFDIEKDLGGRKSNSDIGKGAGVPYPSFLGDNWNAYFILDDIYAHLNEDTGIIKYFDHALKPAKAVLYVPKYAQTPAWREVIRKSRVIITNDYDI